MTDLWIFFARRYFTQQKEIDFATKQVKKLFPLMKTHVWVVEDQEDCPEVGKEDSCILVLCSGGVQRQALACGMKYKKRIVYAVATEENPIEDLRTMCLEKNAAPSTMEVFSMLKRDKAQETYLLLKKENLVGLIAPKPKEQDKILYIGEREPWVLSTCEDINAYEVQCGVKIEYVPIEELETEYNQTKEDVAAFAAFIYENQAKEVLEPDDDDFMRAARLMKALEALLLRHEAVGASLACFSFIKRNGINPCMAVADLNTYTPYFISCEGDLDSALTMYMIRKGTEENREYANPFMANSCILREGLVTFAHCTAPLLQATDELLPYTLRSHHETGIGVSPAVEYPIGIPVWCLRYSAKERSIVCHQGMTCEAPYEKNCRTQIHVKLDHYESFIKNLMGCHLVLIFKDLTEELRTFAKKHQIDWIEE